MLRLVPQLFFGSPSNLHGRRVFDIQNEKHAKAIRLKGEGFKRGEWKNKLPTIILLD
jgi:hypothetical protein